MDGTTSISVTCHINYIVATLLCVMLIAAIVCVAAVGVSTLPVHHFQSFTRTCAICVSLGIRESCRGDCNEQQDTGSCHDNCADHDHHVLITAGVYRSSYGVTAVWYRLNNTQS